MDMIARDVELSKGTIYLYFKNKQSLFYETVIKGMEILRDTFKAAIKKEKTGLDKIKGLVQAFYEYIQNYKDYYRLNLTARGRRFTNMLQNDKIQNTKAYIALTVELLNLLRKPVKLGIRDGSLRPDLDPLKTIMYIGSAIENAVYISPENEMMLSELKIPKDEFLQHSINILLNGIANRK